MKKIALLLLSALILFGCSKKSDKDYLEEAQKNVKAKNSVEAVKNYEALLSEYPDSKLAPKAMFEMGSLYQNKSVKSLPEKESLKKAVDIYKEVFEKYPDSEEAPQALFMAGFIENNELNNYESATSIYKTFIQRYPKHNLVTSAQHELDNMGLTPDEILKKGEQANSK